MKLTQLDLDIAHVRAEVEALRVIEHGDNVLEGLPGAPDDAGGPDTGDG
jgi:hypothetical protein